MSEVADEFLNAELVSLAVHISDIYHGKPAGEQRIKRIRIAITEAEKASLENYMKAKFGRHYELATNMTVMGIPIIVEDDG